MLYVELDRTHKNHNLAVREVGALKRKGGYYILFMPKGAKHVSPGHGNVTECAQFVHKHIAYSHRYNLPPSG